MTINNMPLVSVIVTTYNRKKLLKETIDSILHQTHKNFELIVVDNYSDYDVKSHIKSFNDDRIRFFQNANNGIIAVNRNVGIKKAKGEYIAFCDDDDCWFPNKLDKQIRVFNKNDVKGVGSSMLRFNGDKIYKREEPSKEDVDYYSFDNVLKKNINVPLSSLIIRNNGSLFSQNRDLVCVEDWDFQISLIKMGGCIARVNRPLIKYRVGNVPNPQKKLNNINLLKTYKNLFTEKEYSKSLNKYYKMIGFGYLFVGNRKEAINYLSLINSRFGDSKPFFLTLLKVIPNFLFVIIHYLYLKINLFIK